jgi:hypothetical protein
MHGGPVHQRPRCGRSIQSLGPVERSTQLRYSETLLSGAALGYWWRSIGWKVIFALVCAGAALVVLVASGDRSWQFGLFGALFAFDLVIIAVTYMAQLQRARSLLRAMGEASVIFRASESGFAVESASESASLPWTAVVELWQMPTCWLMLMSKSRFVTLPLADLDDEFRFFVLKQIRAAGGEVS